MAGEKIVTRYIIGFQRIGIQFRSSFHILANLAMKVILAARSNHRSTNLASLPIQQAEYNHLSHRAAPFDLLRPLAKMQVAGFPADEGFGIPP